MQVAIIRNDSIIAGPIRYSAERVRDIVMRQGANPALVPNGLTSALNLGRIKVLPVREDRPDLNERTEHYGTPADTIGATSVTRAYPVEAREPDEIRESLQRELAEYHERQDAGSFEYQGVMIANDLEARINADGILKAFENGTLTERKWRGEPITDEETGEEGPSRITVSSTAEMQSIYDAIFARLNGCFAAREAVEDMLEAATDEDLATFDVQAEFDSAAAQA